MGQVLGVVLEPRGVRGLPLMPEVSLYVAWHPRGGGAGCRGGFRQGKAGSDVTSCACGVWGRCMLVTAVRTMTGGSLLVGWTQVYLLTAEVDADEEAYADAESHYAYSSFSLQRI